MTPLPRLILCTLFLALPVFFSGCAGVLPVPGGTEAVNPSFYTTHTDLLTRLSNIRSGMSEEEVMQKLGRTRGELVTLKRQEILTALTGTDNIEINSVREDVEALQSLYGYRLQYKSVRRQHGFSSPVRVRTDEKGFDYTVTLVFHEDQLCAAPILSGGPVDNASSRTFFDFLNPGTAIDRIGR